MSVVTRMRGIRCGRCRGVSCCTNRNRIRNRVNISRKLLCNCFVFLLFSCISVSESLNIRYRNNNSSTITETKGISTRSNNSPDDKGRDGIFDNLGLKATLVDDNEIAEDKTFFGEDANGNPIVVGTWFQYGSYTLAVAMFGTAFTIACAVVAVYYVLFVVTEPSQLKSLRRRSIADEPGDEMSNTGKWNMTRMLNTLTLAYETYEKLDLYNPDCQKKIICDIQESRYFDESLLRRISHVFFNLDFIKKRVPGIDELRRADKTGMDPSTKCSDSYSSCLFSIDEFQNKFISF